MKVALKFIPGTSDEKKEEVTALVDNLIIQADKYNSRVMGKAMWITEAIHSRKIESVKSFSIL